MIFKISDSITNIIGYRKHTIKSGVYCLVNTITGLIYIGSSENLRTRYLNYFPVLKEFGVYSNTYLENAFLKYSREAFSFILLEHCSPDVCIEREQYYLDNMLFAQEYIKSNGTDNRFRIMSYNINPLAEKRKHARLTDEQRAKISGPNSHKWGTKISEEERAYRRSISLKGKDNPWYGKTPSDETRQKMSLAKLGVKRSQAVRDKMSLTRSGANNNLAKLNELQVRIIRVTGNDLPSRYLGKIFKVDKGTILHIRNNKTWLNV